MIWLIIESMTTTNEAKFISQEIAYRKLTMKGAGGWKRKIITTEKAFDKFIEKMESGDFEFEIRDAE